MKTHTELNINLYIDQTNRRKSLIFNGLIGILLMTVAIVRLVKDVEDESFNRSLVVFLFGYGLFNVIQAAVSNVGKAYIAVDSEQIKIKPKISKKEQSFEWTRIENIEFKLNNIIVSLRDKSIETINLSSIDYRPRKELTGFIIDAAKEKGIHIMS